jgi:poly-gamma-glutamate capsule biosynthesis protein CapA/YwtB (metallophosphatase superfamily)
VTTRTPQRASGRTLAVVLTVVAALAALSLLVLLDGPALSRGGSNGGEDGEEPPPEPAAEGAAQTLPEGGERETAQADADPAPQAPEPPAPVRLAVAGDVHAEPPIEAVLARGDNPLEDVAALLRAADISVVNLETAVGSRGAPAPKQFTFQAPESLWPALVDGGVDVVNLANNHTLDYGTDALLETLDGARAHDLVAVGAGRDAEEAYAPALVEVGSTTVAVVGLSRVLPVVEWAATDRRAGLASAYDEDAAAAAVRAAAALADHVVVAVHWGRELAECPDEVQRRLADRLVDAGADVVAGHHPHVLQGVEERDGALIAYSLGNFVWYARSEPSRTSGVLTVTLDADGAQADFHPARIDGEGSPRLLEGAAADAVSEELTRLDPQGPRCAGTS